MHSILFQVLRANWYIDPDFAQSAGFLISQMLKGQLSFQGDSKKFKPAVNTIEHSGNSGAASEKHAAIISISGPLMKQDQFCGPVGMDTIGGWIKKMDSDPSISSLILQINSPGGTVEGTAILGQTIRDTNKPILAFIDEMACSGGYWLASQCDEIYASTTRARIGSIGVMLAFADMQPAWEKEGVAFHEVYSKHSPDKNKDFARLKKGEYDSYRNDVLDPLAEDFISVIKSNREIIDESIFKGRVVFAADAVDIGLIDNIGSLDDALQRSMELEEQQEINAQTDTAVTTTINSESQNQIIMKTFPLLAAMLGVEALEISEDGAHLSQAYLEIIEDSIASAAQVSADNDGLDTQISDLTGTISERDTRITELEDELAQVRASAGAQPSTVTSTRDKEQSEPGDPMIAELNSTDDTAERISIMRKYGYGS